MIDERIELLLKEWRSIKYVKSEITNCNIKIKQLTRFDKNNSHKNAIEKVMAEKYLQIKNLNEKLHGKTYEDWREFSRKVSAIRSRMKPAQQRIEKLSNELSNLKLY